MRIETDPWEHFVFDDFFTSEDLIRLKELTEFFPVCTDEEKRLRVRFGNKWSYGEEETQESDLEHQRKILSNMVKKKISEIPELKELMSRYVQVEYQSLGKNFTWKVHTDTPGKAFSLVLYWKPKEKSCGTRLYDSDKNFVKEVDWKFNRAVGFWNQPHHQHDFYSDVDERITFNFIFTA